MQNKKRNQREANADKSQQENAFTRDPKERSQNFSNEQNPLVEDGSDNRETKDISTGNLSDQYHSATESGERQEKQSEQNTKASKRGDDYYDRGGDQPDASDFKEVDEKAMKKTKDSRWDKPGEDPRRDKDYKPEKDPNLNPKM